MELVVRLARATYTPIDSFLELPLKRLNEWARIIAKVLESERKEDGRV
jgi:hypothetical protein